ncbi:hypothetical protein [Paenibacillus sp. 1A_MP2]|uniref:hypothetical protein n=1 Tax=Paenibacillus sp. 1A_MP2 TaxID=3457495 RepID=UPI003FCE37C2
MQLYIPIITAILTALTTIGSLIIKDIIFQNKRDSKTLMKERLEKCYTPVYLLLKSKHYENDVDLFLKEIGGIMAQHAHLLSTNSLINYNEVLTKARTYLYWFNKFDNSHEDDHGISKAYEDKRLQLEEVAQREYWDSFDTFDLLFQEEYMQYKHRYIK